MNQAGLFGNDKLFENIENKLELSHPFHKANLHDYTFSK